MAPSTVSLSSTRRKVLGTICLIIFSLAFIFACLQKVLPVGRIIVGTFGIMTYPMFLILALVSLAAVLGFSYTRSIKATTYFLIATLSVLVFIQSLSTFKQLNEVVLWKDFAKYLAYSYNSKITLIGSFGSILCGLIAMPLGAMGSIVVSVISATLFIGLFIDYQFYGKYEPHVKKIKTRAVREKVHKSDKRKTPDGSPIYTFSGLNQNDVVGEITVDENEVNSTTSIYETNVPSYSNADVVGEITDSEVRMGHSVDDEDYSNYSPVSSYGTQTQNTFTNDINGVQTYPGIEINDKDEHRREFMSATFGSGYNSPSQTVQEDTYSSSTNFFGNSVSEGMSSYQEPQQTEEPASFDNSLNDIFGNLSVSETSEQDDEIATILNSSEDDTETEVKKDVFGYTPQEPSYVPTPEPQQPRYDDRVFRGNNFGGYEPPKPQNVPTWQEQTYQRNVPVQEPPKPQITVSSTHPIGPEPIVVPTKQPAFTGFGNTNVQTGFSGVRYNAPPLNLLKAPKADSGDYTAEQNRKSNQLEQVLEAFGVLAKVVNIVRGPKITRYELSLPYGTSVKQIPKYEDDIAAALAAKTIVIKAPIPGSRFVGIELENDTFTSVYERELLESDAFQNCKDPLPIAIGKDISGEIVVKSLAKMVHLLIAGSTGSGKSVFMHNIILSLLYKSSPDDLKLIMIDPKRVEFNRYNGLPHLLTPEVVAGSEKAINAFKWCVKEMERRYDLMSKAGYNNIEPYNKSELVKAGQFEKFPYIVIVVDELAEIMAVNKKDVELCIQRLTQLARACGMHLIVATQRPSVDIITGVIKNNIPSRIAFSLQSGIDSKTILNAVGAEKLLGQGDMIFAPTGTSATPRLQAAYATDDEIKSVIDFVKRNNVASFDETVDNIINAEQTEAADDASSSGGSGFMDAPPPKDVDSYFKTAVKLVMANGGASVSYLQRRLQIGYSRAARIIDQMEDKGFIAPSTGAKLRKVLITPDQFREEFGDDYDSIND